MKDVCKKCRNILNPDSLGVKIYNLFWSYVSLTVKKILLHNLITFFIRSNPGQSDKDSQICDFSITFLLVINCYGKDNVMKLTRIH